MELDPTLKSSESIAAEAAAIVHFSNNVYVYYVFYELRAHAAWPAVPICAEKAALQI